MGSRQNAQSGLRNEMLLPLDQQGDISYWSESMSPLQFWRKTAGRRARPYLCTTKNTNAMSPTVLERQAVPSTARKPVPADSL
ncbi:unnamed protein product [Caenorhabditis auriculariae]|uniref:Uncharacterized protein n=1 Tax=Caenorhabditis auriculariae TaxID=2777116 RepID=A0A8S1GQH2_9PELO|nr:unnamed protein product [Caenorhabditis auriculariae]